MYYSHKKFFSIILQGVVDANYKFICIDVGAYGKQSDSGVFGHSQLARALEIGALKTNTLKILPGTDIEAPHVVIGDGGFPLKTYLLRPYPLRGLTTEQENYNKRLSGARQVVECAFGIISHKWRILLKAIEIKPERAEHIVKCICLLHNIVINKEGPSDMIPGTSPLSLHWNTSHSSFSGRATNRGSHSSMQVRETFKMFFSRQGDIETTN
ncbi:unnamed protein product [Acanthoscelides obtectus]|uniref:DDE Tnp4 domain-containing protein n=1 Tax=Acanthoscelides obtectus TaxID=200917 RepID=A0A9P0LP11_ACAOB|nr:unnamed protein product [Acanthoscelides obtectus]CAK1681187.1 Protein ALP1-like [Acanthoscelides obtectus]